MGIIGPDGVGKSTLLSLVAGARMIQSGGCRCSVATCQTCVFATAWRRGSRICLRVWARTCMPPCRCGNVDFFGRLFGQGNSERRRRIAELLDSTGLAPFAGRAAGKLSGE